MVIPTAANENYITKWHFCFTDKEIFHSKPSLYKNVLPSQYWTSVWWAQIFKFNLTAFLSIKIQKFVMKFIFYYNLQKKKKTISAKSGIKFQELSEKVPGKPWLIRKWQQQSHPRNHSGYGLSQWKKALLCNAFSHWLSPSQNDPCTHVDMPSKEWYLGPG